MDTDSTTIEPGGSEERTDSRLKPTMNFRWYRPARGDDMDRRLQQRWYDPGETRDAEPIWIDVPVVMED